MSALMLLLNDVIIPLSEGLIEREAMEEEKKEQTVVGERPDTLVGPRSLVEGVTSDKEGFSVKLDVQQFKPEEVKVSTFEDTLTIEGKHAEQKDEHGFISRHFVRRYILPKDVDMDKVECRITADGILCVCVPKVGIYKI